MHRSGRLRDPVYTWVDDKVEWAHRDSRSRGPAGYPHEPGGVRQDQATLVENCQTYGQKPQEPKREYNYIETDKWGITCPVEAVMHASLQSSLKIFLKSLVISIVSGI